MRYAFSVAYMTALVVLTSSTMNAEEDGTPLAWPARELRTVGIESPATPPWLSSTVAATDSGFVARQVRVPAGQSLPIKASWSDDGKLVADVGGNPRVIAVHIKWIYDGDQKEIRNPLSTMSDEEIGGLWGIVIDAWSKEMEQQLRAIDRNNVLITVTQDWHEATTNPLPPLPTDIRYLRVVFNSSEGPITDMSLLRSLTDLRYFELDGYPKLTFDANLLSRCEKLEHLALTDHEIENMNALASLSELRHLHLPRYRDKLHDLAFVAAFSKLETLDVSMSAVSGLDSLAGLQRLKWVNADWTGVDRLPVKLPLRVLRVQSTRLSDEQVAKFASANPRCLIMHRWDDSLKNMISDATRLSIHASRYAIDGDDKATRPLFETDDSNDIAAVVDGIRIDESKSGFHCMCEGTPFLKFYRGEELLAIVGFHHGRSLRWAQGWPGDGMLTRQSGSFLVDWLANHGVRGPASEIMQAKEQQLTADRKTTRAIAGLPKEVAEAFVQRSDRFVEVLRRLLPDTHDQIVALLRIYGTDNSSWTELDWIDQFAEAELGDYDTDELARAVESALQGDDRRARRGAARFWQSWDSPLDGWNPNSLSELHPIVINVMIDSHYYPLRQDALRSLLSWHRSFAKEEQLAIVNRGLRDPHPSVRRAAMLTAGNLNLNSTTDHLMRVLRGKKLIYDELPDVPEDETIDVREGFDDVAGKRSEKEVAALALGFLRYSPAAEVISQQAEASPMYEVALALLGNYDQLKPYHFRLRENNTALQFAALKVVIDTRGAHGLKWATEYEQSQYGWEEEVVASKLSHMLVAENAPGADMLVDSSSLDDVVKWYQQHGAAYLRKIAKSQVPTGK
jgi:hypothetical protein